MTMKGFLISIILLQFSVFTENVMACNMVKLNGWAQESVAGTDSFQYLKGRKDISVSVVSSDLEADSAPDKARLKEFIEKLAVLKGATFKLLGMDNYSIKNYVFSESPSFKKITLQSVYKGQDNNKYKATEVLLYGKSKFCQMTFAAPITDKDWRRHELVAIRSLRVNE